MAYVYNRGKLILSNASTDWTSTDIRVLLVTSAYAYNEDNNYVSDITGELSGGGYSRQPLTTRTITQDDTTNRSVLAGANTLFASLGAAAGNPAAAIVYKYNVSDAAAELISYEVLTAPPIPNGGDYTIVWSPDGVVYLGD